MQQQNVWKSLIYASLMAAVLAVSLGSSMLTLNTWNPQSASAAPQLAPQARPAAAQWPAPATPDDAPRDHRPAPAAE